MFGWPVWFLRSIGPLRPVGSHGPFGSVVPFRLVGSVYMVLNQFNSVVFDLSEHHEHTQ